MGENGRTGDTKGQGKIGKGIMRYGTQSQKNKNHEERHSW